MRDQQFDHFNIAFVHGSEHGGDKISFQIGVGSGFQEPLYFGYIIGQDCACE
jgi:hypothetical protein